MWQWKKQEEAFWFYMLPFYNCRTAVNLIWHDEMGRRILEKMGKSWWIAFFTIKFHFEFLGFKTHFLKHHSSEFASISLTFFLTPQLFNSSLTILYLEVFWIYIYMHKLPLKQRRSKSGKEKGSNIHDWMFFMQPKDLASWSVKFLEAIRNRYQALVWILILKSLILLA